MRYRQFDGQLDELKRRIKEVEREHCVTEIDLRVAETLKDDSRILAGKDQMKLIEQTLKALYKQLPDNG